MNTKEFRAVLDWFMCSDPWPVPEGEDNHRTIEAWLNQAAVQRGYKDLVGAYHYEEKIAK